MNIYRKIKWFIQRGRRGWADCDVWDMHSYLSDILPKMLRKIKNESVGCPSELYNSKAKNHECDKWNEIIEEIAQGFESAQFLNEMKFMKWVDSKKHKRYKVLETDYKSMDNARKKMEKGLKLFAKYYLQLWD